VAWVGDARSRSEARARFWPLFERYAVEKNLEFSGRIVEKYADVCALAIAHEGVRVERFSGRIARVRLESLAQIDPSLHGGGGLFYEVEIDSLEALFAAAERKYQTLALEGFDAEEVGGLIRRMRPKGFDRIVRIGSAHTFSTLWDGYDLLRAFSRSVDVAL
jgi:hypothetical protein